MNMMQKLVLVAVIIISQTLIAEDSHVFRGKHFIASYLDCDHTTLTDVLRLKKVMEEAVIASGASLLDQCDYVFPPNGLTMVFLLSESHASIHTYPEYNACFIDLFTCGSRASYETFDAILQEYLKPKRVEKKLLLREHQIEELF